MSRKFCEGKMRKYLGWDLPSGLIDNTLKLCDMTFRLEKKLFSAIFWWCIVHNIQNIKYSPVLIDLSWLELTFHKKQEIMTSSILPTYPRGTIAFAMNVKCFSVIGLSRPFQSFVGKNQCQYFGIKFEDFHFSRYVCLLNFTNSRRNDFFLFIFPKTKRVSYKVIYLESRLWKCFERFCE